MEIRQLQVEVKRLLDTKGFAYDKSTFHEKASLAHTEISELVDVIKKKGYEAQEDIEEEVADIIIRTVNFALMFDFDLDTAVQNKMRKNFERPVKYNTVEEVKEEPKPEDMQPIYFSGFGVGNPTIHVDQDVNEPIEDTEVEEECPKSNFLAKYLGLKNK